MEKAAHKTHPSTVDNGFISKLSASRSSLREDRAETEPYVSYSMERQADVGLAKRVLFFVHDVEGNTKLAVTVCYNTYSMKPVFRALMQGEQDISLTNPLKGSHQA